MKGYNMMSIKGNSKSYIEILSTYGALAETMCGTFDFEIEDRLTYWHSDHGTWDDECQYTADRNIQYRTGLGYYDYHPTSSVQPHAVKDVENTSGRVSWDSHDLTFKDLGKVSYISSHENGSYGIVYAPDDGRWESLLYNSSQWPDMVRRYVGDMEIVSSGPSEVCRFYYLGHGVVLRKVNNTVTPLYAFTDNLGSITRLYTANGTEKFKAQYDPWGVQKVIKNDINFARGYCGHEMLNWFQLINMNGRLYDPMLGRFLSPDNYVQMPTSTQSFNRYSYCLNNPLKYVDPDGNSFIASIVTGALIGALLSGGTYSVSALISRNKWNKSDFWKSIGIGAFSGALGGALGELGTKSNLFGNFGNTLGYKLLSQTSNAIVTNTVFDKDISLSNIIAIGVSAYVGIKLPKFKATEKSLLNNGFNELKHNIASGFITGATQGIVNSVFKKDASYIYKSALGGVISSIGRTLTMDVFMGLPFKPDESIKTDGQFRKGFFLKAFTQGITLGRQIFVGSIKSNSLLHHENYHIIQQENYGFAEFYRRIINDYFDDFIHGRDFEGDFDVEADKYSGFMSIKKNN